MNLRVLHLLGSEEDTGGVLSVIRNLQEATRSQSCQHLSWVHHRFVQTRSPKLDLRLSKHLVMETPRYSEFLWRGSRAFLELQSLLKREPCHVLHAHSRGPLIVVMLAALLRRERSVFTNHAFARQRWFYRAAARWPRLSTTVLTPNMARHYGLTPSPRRVEILSECCADSLFARPLPNPSPQPSHFPIRLVGIGNLIRWKKWDIVLHALGNLPVSERSQWRFDLFGPTPSDPDSQRYAAELQTLASALHLESLVRFRGPTHDVPGALQAADWFILPSTNEPCSVALIEALALGVPALATESGGNIDILHHQKTGLLFTPDSPVALTHQLRQISQRAFVPVLPAAIRESVRSRSATEVARAFLDLYRAPAP